MNSGFGKSGGRRFPQGDENLPTKEPMRPSRDSTYNYDPSDSNPKFSRRNHMAGHPNEDMDFDTSDTPQEPVPARRKGPPSAVPVRRNPAAAARGHSYNPGLPPERKKNEATPFGGPERRTTGSPMPTGQPDRRRARRDTTPFQMRATTPLQTPTMSPGKAQTAAGESSWDVYVDGGGVYKVPAGSDQEAIARAEEWLNAGGDPEHSGKKFQRGAFQAVRSEASSGGDMGGQPQRELGTEGLKYFRYLVNQRIQEIVRKKEGGGGYNLYAPNKGKKKSPKPVGDFPTKLAAKRAELARFPPKDPEQLKRARKRLEKLSKNPKKRIEKEKDELRSKAPKSKGRPSGERKTRKESIIDRLAVDLHERLFREEELAGSPWDERVANLHPDALSSDKKLHRYHQGMEKASMSALGDGHRALAKALRGVARIHPGDISRDPERGKMFMPVNLEVDGQEIGPVHLYIDGGHVCIEVSPDARELISGLDPGMAKNLRGGLMSFQEDHLPKIDSARKAWGERDGYLDKLHKKLEKQVTGMSPVEIHLAKQLLNKGRKR